MTDCSEYARDLERRVADLEWQLETYHRQLEDALAYNGERQLNATWGIVRGTGFMAFLGAYWLIDKQWRLHVDASPGWLVSAGIFFAAGFVWYWYAEYVERGYKQDEKNMWSWPKWQPPVE